MYERGALRGIIISLHARGPEKMRNKNSLFTGLLGASVAILGVIVFLILFMLLNIENQVFKWILVALIVVAVAFVVLLAIGVFAMAKRTRPAGRLGRALMRRVLALYPVAMGIGKLFGIKKDDIKKSFVEINNNMVRSNSNLKVPAENIVVLTPHCLQNTLCPVRVTLDVEACQECGLCDIAQLKKLCKSLGVKLIVVTGGTLARSYIKEQHPKAVVAVACENDLFSGIMDVLPLPAIGVFNERPEGPCKNTKINIEDVEKAILFFKD